MRFAACHFCQLRIHQLVTRWQELDENGLIERIYYGKESGDHMPFDSVKDFASFQNN